MPTFFQQPRCFCFVCLFALTVAGLTQAASDESGANEFRQSNSGYVQRAGSFYETDYLPGAVKGLKAAFAPQQLDDATARRLLLDLIYSFLEHYTADGGAITRRHHAAVLDKLDKQVRRLADDPAILKRYEKWKLGSDADYPNPLNFLTLLSRQSPPMKLELNQSLKDAGVSQGGCVARSCLLFYMLRSFRKEANSGCHCRPSAAVRIINSHSSPVSVE